MDPYATSWSVQILYKSTASTATQVVEAGNRRRMEREAKAKVVAPGCGAEFIQFLATLLLFLPRSIWKKRLNSSSNECGSMRIRTAYMNAEDVRLMSYLGPPPPRNNHWTSRKKRFV